MVDTENELHNLMYVFIFHIKKKFKECQPYQQIVFLLIIQKRDGSKYLLSSLKLPSEKDGESATRFSM